MEIRVAKRRKALLAVTALAAAGVVQLMPVSSAGAEGGTISGVAFKDVNRDGVMQPDEEPLADEYIWLLDGSGAYLRNARTDAAGAYQLTDVAAGTYRVQYWPVGWSELSRDWTPSTTGSIHPIATVQVAGSRVVNFGFRPIVRSVVENAPVSAFTAPSGLKVHSYNDVVTAAEVYDALKKGTLHGGEASATTIHFDWGTGDYCTASTVQAGGRYGQFSAGCQIDFLKWLTFGDKYLFHEYGHAWGDYHAYVVQQDPTLAGYLALRGIKEDLRLGSTHAWSSFEMLAEDYRTLFGSSTARVEPQENAEIPPASAIPGLREYLSTTFMAPPAVPPPPPDPAPATSHVADLDGQASTGNRNWTATVATTVKDGNGQPVAGATVSLAMGSGKQARTFACTTSASGQCTVDVTLASKTRTATLTVTSVAKSGLTYTPSANNDPDGDSNGTTIVVSKPGG